MEESNEINESKELNAQQTTLSETLDKLKLDQENKFNEKVLEATVQMYELWMQSGDFVCDAFSLNFCLLVLILQY